MNSEKRNGLFRELILEEGTHVNIRPITPEDFQIEWDFVHNLSSHSRYFRFMSALKDLNSEMVRHFTHIDFSKDMALIATIKDENEKLREIAVGRYFKDKKQPVCEFALVVADDFQNKGIGNEIMKMLIQDAKDKGYECMEGEILASNKRMLDFTRGQGFKLETSKEDKTLIKAKLFL